MAGKLDGPGTVKMQTLEEAGLVVQRLHGIVEQMAMAVSNQKSSAAYGLQLRRAGTPLIGLLKGHFGPVSDYVVNMLLVATRGGSEQMKVRSLREAIGSLKQQLETAGKKVKEQHTVAIETDATTKKD
jgi:hypothetical protein